MIYVNILKDIVPYHLPYHLPYPPFPLCQPLSALALPPSPLCQPLPAFCNPPPFGGWHNLWTAPKNNLTPWLPMRCSRCSFLQFSHFFCFFRWCCICQHYLCCHWKKNVHLKCWWKHCWAVNCTYILSLKCTIPDIWWFITVYNMQFAYQEW